MGDVGENSQKTSRFFFCFTAVQSDYNCDGSAGGMLKYERLRGPSSGES